MTVINLQEYKRSKCANELAYLANFAEDNLRDLINKLAESVSEFDEQKYLCEQQNKQASKSKL